MDGFHVGVIMNDDALSICVQVLAWTYVFNSLGNIESGIVGSHVNSMFNPLSNCPTVFQSDCAILDVFLLRQ